MYNKREIRFRAKEKDNGQWEYGLLSYSKEGLAIVNTDGMGLSFHAPCDPNTIGEYTGVKDSNGREIYEGDIVRLSLYDDLSQISQVYWEAGGFVVDCDKIDSEYDFMLIGEAVRFMDRVEVIGTVYDDSLTR